MSYDPHAFHHAYIGDAALPHAITPSWAIVRIVADRVRRAIDLVVEGPDGATITIFVERRTEGTAFLVETEHLHLSYYSDASLDDAVAADIVRAAAAMLRDREPAISAELLGSVFDTNAERSRRATGDHMVEVRINRDCNEACLFCNTPERSEAILPNRDAIVRTIENERAAGFRHITLTGREPTLDPALADYLSLARALGYRTIRVQTNGTAFANRDVLARLIGAGMNVAEVSLHTTDASVFRTLVNADPKLLDMTLAGLDNLAHFPSVTTTLVVVLTRFNLAGAADLVAYVATHMKHVQHITLSPMAPVGDGAGRADAIPRLVELTAAFDDIFAAAQQHGVQVVVPSRCGAPLCIMPPRYLAQNLEYFNTPGEAAEAGKSKPPSCRACVYDSMCAGVWNGYLELYGPDELTPVARRPRQDDHA